MLPNEVQKGDYFVSADKILGEGTFGKAFKCRKGEMYYCMKQISKVIQQNHNEQMTYGNEINAVNHLMNTYCENVTEVFDIFQDENNVYIIMELCDMDLEQDLSKNHTRMEQLDMIRQIMNGMKHLFNNQMIHRDLKPENILIKKYKKGNEELRIYKISDFGFSRTLTELYAKQNISFVGTPKYCSPQILANQECSAKCDIFSLGILFYQIFYKQLPPFAETNQVLKLKENPLKCPQLNGEYAEEIKSLLERMIAYEEDNRIKFEDLFSHKLFTMPLLFNDPLIVDIEGNHNERIKKVLELFYHKFQLCDLTVKKFEEEIQLPTIDSNFCYYLILYIGMLQIRYAFAFIYGNISDLHPYFRNGDELPRLLELITKFKEDQTYNQIIQTIRMTYYQHAALFRTKSDELYTELCQKMMTSQNFEKQSIEKYKQQYETISLKYINFETLRNLLYNTLYKTSFSECFHKLDKTLHKQILNILEIETRLKMSNYFFIDL